MPESPNPYEPPSPLGYESGWWDRMLALFRKPVAITRSVRDPSLLEFVGGSPIHYYGVVFFVDPSDPTVVHAAIALRENEADLVQRCVAEVRRVLPGFFWEYSDLEKAVKHRTLVVRFIDDYLELSEVAKRVTAGPITTLAKSLRAHDTEMRNFETPKRGGSLQ